MERHHRQKPRLTTLLSLSKAKLELVVVVVLTLLFSILSFSFEIEFVETLYSYSRAHEDWELDEFIFSFFWLAVFLFVYSLRRVGDLKQLNQENEYHAHYDYLTGLPNRKYALDHLERTLLHAKWHNQSVAVVYMDLNHFKQINDFFGHPIGDVFIKEVSQRLASTRLSSELIARIGGDEFLFISELPNHDSNAASIITRIKSALEQNLVIDEKTIQASFSIGIALYPEHGRNVEELIVAADSAMYYAKRSKSISECYYTEEIGIKNNARIQLEKHLKDALMDDQLYLVYQPIIDVTTGNAVGFEALTRWKLNGKRVNPELIVSTADNAGLAELFYTWLFRTAANDVALFVKDDQFISLNISAMQFLNEHFLNHVKNSLLQSTPVQIEFEITESSIFTDHEKASSTISTLRQLGINTMIDDFGKDYSSLSRLSALDVDKIKIDKSFLHNATIDTKSLGIFLSVIELARKLELVVVVEGIETIQQLNLLQQHAPLLGQGYLFQMPLPKDEIPNQYCLEKLTASPSIQS